MSQIYDFTDESGIERLRATISPSPGGGLSSYPADTAGATTGTQTPDPIRGSDSFAWVQFPSDAVALAWGLVGDDFPRIVFGADPTDFGAVMFGDGTVDPALNGQTLYLATAADGQPAMTVQGFKLGNRTDGSLIRTDDPAIAGMLWNDAGTVKVSAG